jgi:hypothetical protein
MQSERRRGQGARPLPDEQGEGSGQADRLLERVRSQLADALFPLTIRLVVGGQHEFEMQYELDLPIGKKRHLDKRFVRPLVMSGRTS